SGLLHRLGDLLPRARALGVESRGNSVSCGVVLPETCLHRRLPQGAGFVDIVDLLGSTAQQENNLVVWRQRCLALRLQDLVERIQCRLVFLPPVEHGKGIRYLSHGVPLVDEIPHMLWLNPSRVHAVLLTQRLQTRLELEKSTNCL